MLINIFVLEHFLFSLSFLMSSCCLCKLCLALRGESTTECWYVCWNEGKNENMCWMHQQRGRKILLCSGLLQLVLRGKVKRNAVIKSMFHCEWEWVNLRHCRVLYFTQKRNIQNVGTALLSGANRCHRATTVSKNTSKSKFTDIRKGKMEGKSRRQEVGGFDGGFLLISANTKQFSFHKWFWQKLNSVWVHNVTPIHKLISQQSLVTVVSSTDGSDSNSRESQ